MINDTIGKSVTNKHNSPRMYPTPLQIALSKKKHLLVIPAILAGLSCLHFFLDQANIRILTGILGLVFAITGAMALYSNKTFKLPWLLLSLAIGFKATAWSGIGFYNLPNPVSDSPYYFFDLLGTAFICGFGILLIRIIEIRHNVSGFFADCAMLFLALSLMLLVIFYQEFSEISAAFNHKIPLALLQLLLSVFFLFILTCVSLLVGNNLGIYHLLTAASALLSLHYWWEFKIYINALFVPYEDLRLTRLSAFSFDLSAAFTITYMLLTQPLQASPFTKKSFIKLSPLVWISSALLLLALPIGLIFRSFNGIDSAISYNVNYLIAITAGLIIFIRFSALVLLARKHQQILEYEATYDALSGLMNRRGLLEVFNALPQGNYKEATLCALDIDAFKSVNDLYGHNVGDEAIKIIANKIKNFDDVITAGRIGGDEFVVLLKASSNTNKIVESMQKSLSAWHHIDGLRVFVGTSIGATSFFDEDFDAAYKRADIALYKAKKEHTGSAFYNQNISSEENHQYILELIQTAIDEKSLTLRYQPIFDIQSHQFIGVEALLRLEDKNGRILPPSVFLHIAKEHSKMPEVTMQLVRQVHQDLQSLPDHITVSINIPPDILVTRRHELNFLELLEELNLPKERVIFEITEEDNTNINYLAQTVSKLVTEGYRFALDDFGAGSSSLSRLAIVPVTTVKLDITLLRAASRGRIAPLESATALAKRLDAKVTIEGVENEDQLDIARKVEADSVQGFYLSKPVSLETVATLPKIWDDFPKTVVHPN